MGLTWPLSLFGELLVSCKKGCHGVPCRLRVTWNESDLPVPSVRSVSFGELCALCRKELNELILYIRWKWRCGSLTLSYLSLFLSVSLFLSFQLRFGPTMKNSCCVLSHHAH